MATKFDLSLGLNLTIGSVPLALKADVQQSQDQSVYTFNGCIQDAHISFADFLAAVGTQFQVDVQLPPELNLNATIDYLAGQVICTKPASGAQTTAMGLAGQFELTGAGITLQFYAGSVSQNPPPASGNPYVVGAAIQTDLRFANLPLVGSIPGVKDYGLSNIGFSYTNSSDSEKPVEFQIPEVSSATNPLYTRTDPTAKNAKSYAITSAGNTKKFTLNKKGFALTAGLVNHKDNTQAQSFALPMALPATAAPPTPAQPAGYYKPASGLPTSPPASPVHWINVNKTFGPVDLQKIGVNYSGGEASFGLSAGFTVGGFSMGLEGLTITFPLPLPGIPAGHSVTFDLAGMTLDIKRGNLEIGGAFLKTSDRTGTSYLGAAIVQVGNKAFKAMGGYSPGDPASFFLYCSLDAPLGGPPFLFVTGLAGGFGINRSLILPTIDTLSGYILLPQNAPAQGSNPSSTMQTVLPKMQSVFINQPGQYWIAAGIQFTSFEMIHAFALVTVAFGVDLQVALLGTCSMTLPSGSPNPIAYIEIDLLASFSASSGLLAIQGKLTPASYLYGGFCKLTGGFAFFIWFSGPHEGDFVVTLGGYHPAFQKPAHYPTVPRLGMAFSLGALNVTGQSYFALTPAMLMAGVRMSATWNSGPVSAWLDAGIDFLLAWAPFHYEARAYICIGCSVDLGLFTISAHVGADLSIWGPPFGGRAEVDLSVTSFTISFGASQQLPPPVGWSTFKTNFLPKDTGGTPAPRRALFGAMPMDVPLSADPPSDPSKTNIIKASVGPGLAQTNFGGFDWIVNPDGFQIVTYSTIPANHGEWAGLTGEVSNNPNDYQKAGAAPYLKKPPQTYSDSQVWNPLLNIAAMDQKNVQSYHTVQFLMRNADGQYKDTVTSLSVEPALLNSSAALWAPNPSARTAGAPALWPWALTGFQITPIPRHPDQVSGVPLLDLLFAQGYKTTYVYQAKSIDTRYTVTSTENKATLTIQISGGRTATITNQNYILSALADATAATQRQSILSDLKNNGFSTYGPGDVNVTTFATKTALVNWPMVKLLGDI